MAKKKNKAVPQYMEEAIGGYRCPKCSHRWEQRLDKNAECPKCGEVQGPMVVK